MDQAPGPSIGCRLLLGRLLQRAAGRGVALWRVTPS